MSNALLRRNSRKRSLDNLMRLMAQRSIEDAEEVERERRRRAREASRWTNDSSARESSSEHEMGAEENAYDGDLKPDGCPSLDEDEGFSDWTQRRERRRQQRMQELNQGAEENENEEEATTNKAAKTVPASITASSRLQRQEHEGVDGSATETERRSECEEETIQAERVKREEEDERKIEEAMTKRPNTEVEKRKEVKVSYTSKVFLQQEPKHHNANGDPTNEEETSYVHNQTKSRAMEEAEVFLEKEHHLEKIRQGLQQKESPGLEQLRQRQAEAEQEVEELKRRREERHRVREEEDCRREEEEQLRLAKEEEEKRRMKKDIERRRIEAAERMKNLSISSMDGDEMFSPKTPTYKITERTESLNRSVKKSNSFKKMLPVALLPKIDDKVEQYVHAVENSQETRTVKASLADLPSSPEVVASKKTLFEAGEAWSQSPTKGATCKDTEALKVGVADLITQWVKGPSDSSRQSPSRTTDLKSGDVMQKKNMWEGIGDSSQRPVQRSRASSAVKKYTFVVTGHGKYEKIAADDEVGGELSNGTSDLYQDY
ncbi:non-muscle caldesmon [Brachionichthys hirsutus]|uniref:non-muscle caldesmon n=1 Tax=Brachionichthys hirsutus TaxID=412623 RepID=UPI0036046CAE